MVRGDGPLLDLRAPTTLPRVAARVLVVHGDTPTRKLLVEVLADLPASIEACDDGDGALRLLDRREFDLVIVGEWLAGARAATIAEACLRRDVPIAVVILDTDGPFGHIDPGGPREPARVSCPFSPAALVALTRERIAEDRVNR